MSILNTNCSPPRSIFIHVRFKVDSLECFNITVYNVIIVIFIMDYFYSFHTFQYQMIVDMSIIYEY